MGGTICRSRADGQVSKSQLWLPFYFVNRFVESTRIAEETLGKPPTVFEIFTVMDQNFGRAVNNIYQLVAILFSLLREDLIYSDEHSYRYTVNKQEGYYNYTELFSKKFPAGYACDSIGRVIPTTARVVNLHEMR